MWMLIRRPPGSFRLLAESQAVLGQMSLWLGLILGFERLLGLWPTPSSRPATVHKPLCFESLCLPPLPLKDSCDYSGPTQIRQDNFPILKSVISNFSYICKVPFAM